MNTRLVTNGTYFRVQVEAKENNWRDVTEGLDILPTGEGFAFEERIVAKRTLARLKIQLGREEALQRDEWKVVE